MVDIKSNEEKDSPKLPDFDESNGSPIIIIEHDKK